MFGKNQEHLRCNFVSTDPSSAFQETGGMWEQPFATLGLHMFKQNWVGELVSCFGAFFLSPHLCFYTDPRFAETPIFDLSNAFLVTSLLRSYLEINIFILSGFESTTPEEAHEMKRLTKICY